MTEKRFWQKDEDGWEIFDRNKHLAYAHSGYNAEKIIGELNELVEENEELDTKCSQLEKENEELKKERNYFERKKCEYWNKYNHAHLDRINLEIENEQLKKELFEVEKDYLIETTDEDDDVVDLGKEIGELRKGIFG